MAREFEDPPAREAPKFYPWSRGAESGAGAGGGPICAICGTRLDVHEAARGQTCAKPDCKIRFLKRLLKLEKEKQDRIWQAALERSVEVAEALEIDAELVSIGVVPSNGRPLTVLPEKRRRAFEDRLRLKIDEALAQLAETEPSVPQPETPPREAIEDPAVLGLLATACGVCRGACCPQGRTHAFITVETIVRYLDSHPGSSPDEIADAYLSYLGAPSYEDSCVFHGRTGCFLPRDMRSDTCNEYLCKDVYKFGRRLETEETRRGIVIAMVDEEIVRSASVDARGARYHEAQGPPGS